MLGLGAHLHQGLFLVFGGQRDLGLNPCFCLHELSDFGQVIQFPRLWGGKCLAEVFHETVFDILSYQMERFFTHVLRSREKKFQSSVSPSLH